MGAAGGTSEPSGAWEAHSRAFHVFLGPGLAPGVSGSLGPMWLCGGGPWALWGCWSASCPSSEPPMLTQLRGLNFDPLQDPTHLSPPPGSPSSPPEASPVGSALAAQPLMVNSTLAMPHPRAWPCPWSTQPLTLPLSRALAYQTSLGTNIPTPGHLLPLRASEEVVAPSHLPWSTGW